MRQTLNKVAIGILVCIYPWGIILIQQVFSCNICISPIEGALSLSLSFVTALSGLSEILQGECRSHPAPDQYCTEDATPGAYTCKNHTIIS